MGLLTTRGFFSVVAHRNEPDAVLVRARARIDLESLEDLIPDIAIEHTPLADYGWRAVVPRAAWSQVLVALLDELDYSNFKSAVASRQSVDRATLYARVWLTLRELQGC